MMRKKRLVSLVSGLGLLLSCGGEPPPGDLKIPVKGDVDAGSNSDADTGSASDTVPDSGSGRGGDTDSTTASVTDSGGESASDTGSNAESELSWAEACAKKLIDEMTLEEKVSQLDDRSPAIERLGIGAYNWWNEALHGVARAGLATVFPQAIALAATFDPTKPVAPVTNTFISFVLLAEVSQAGAAQYRTRGIELPILMSSWTFPPSTIIIRAHFRMSHPDASKKSTLLRKLAGSCCMGSLGLQAGPGPIPRSQGDGLPGSPRRRSG